MATTDQYLNLITSEYRGQPNFEATVALSVSVQVQVQNLLLSMIPIFDVDTAVGNQLDIIGQWVGISRDVIIPVTGIFFTWDGDASLGWDYGIWQSAISPTSITVLPDDNYRILIKAKIAANSWDGTTTGAYMIWEKLFPNLFILIQDYQDMSYDLIFFGGILDSLTLALLQGGYIPLKPEGVRVNNYYVPIDSNKLFGWDLENTYFAGWDEGSWAKQYPAM